MSTLLNRLADHKSFEDIRDALKGIGCEVCQAQTLKDLEKVIKDQAVAGAQVVINGAIQQGPGMKVTQIDKSGYRLSATGEAPITNSVSPQHPVGTQVQQVLYDIVNVMIPKILKDATMAPSVVGADLFKSMADGVDYYQNLAFGRDGHGRKNGLHPNSWYLRLYLHSHVEPLYVSMLPLMADLKSEIMNEIKHMSNPIDTPEESSCGCSRENIDSILNG